MMEDSSDSDEYDNDLMVYTADEILRFGLQLVGYTRRRIRRAKKDTNVDRFLRGHFESNLIIYAAIWEDLQMTKVEEAQVPPKDLNILFFLMAMHHLKRYPAEVDREALFDISQKWGRNWCWYYIEKVQALKAQKITWLDDFGNDIWVLIVDGTQCWIQEPQRVWLMDSKYYSHKYAKAGINYELGMSLVESRLIWMNGPFKAGSNNVSTFIRKGLKAKLQAFRK
jgi:hypothetical protein